MKNILLSLCLLATLAGAACDSTPVQEEQQTETRTQQAAVVDSSQAYICPMGCEGSASSKPGKCPVCGMDLQKNPAHAAADSAAHGTR